MLTILSLQLLQWLSPDHSVNSAMSTDHARSVCLSADLAYGIESRGSVSIVFCAHSLRHSSDIAFDGGGCLTLDGASTDAADNHVGSASFRGEFEHRWLERRWQETKPDQLLYYVRRQDGRVPSALRIVSLTPSLERLMSIRDGADQLCSCYDCHGNAVGGIHKKFCSWDPIPFQPLP